MTDKFYTQSNINSVHFVPHNNLPSFPYNWTEKLLYPSTYDSDFLQITGFSSTFFSSYAIASNTLIMLVYQSKRITNNYLAIKVSYPPVYEENDFSIKIEETKVICDTLGPSANHLIGPVGKNLMFTFGNNKNYLLNGNMDTTFLKNSYQFNQIFEWKGNQYSFANVVDSGYTRTCLVRSSDEGYNWEIIAEGLSYHYKSLNFSHIGNKLIANSFGNQIWEIEISNNGVTSKELVNDGLADVKIKAITYSNNKVFVATETGVFERSLTEFIEYK
ncbi:MAG: hypothetical protein JNK73_09280 [Bacteroidia bacterium]|nr:hypothetical protein [Bacteroidia bacterium]